MPLRNRDLIALILALILVRLVWNDSQESLSASAHLAFYFPRDNTPIIAPMDLDGDGSSEAVAIVKSNNDDSKSSWVVQIMDVKALHHHGKTQLAPFRPNVLFTSAEMDMKNAAPLKLTSGQVLINKEMSHKRRKKAETKISKEDFDDRTRHFFCGFDWHDASSKCGTPCPGGLPSECPEGERCFADTPCDALSSNDISQTTDTESTLQLTPGGGLPSLVTLWSNGTVSLHSLTADKESDNDNTNSPKNNKQLDIRLMWRSDILKTTSNDSENDKIQWDESTVNFFDAIVSEEASAPNGMVVISGSYNLENQQDIKSPKFIIALDALSGQVLWDSFSQENEADNEPLLLPMHRGTSSYARRRSKIPSLHPQLPIAHPELDTGGVPNCLVAYKHSIQQALPYTHWSEKDTKLFAIHLDQNRKVDHAHDEAAMHHTHENQIATKHLNKKDSKWKPKSHKTKHHQRALNAKPNALVLHSNGGIQVRSLKNGRSLCHISLLEETMYTDLNRDGVLDQVQVLMHNKLSVSNGEWVWRLMKKLQKRNDKDNEDSADSNNIEHLVPSSARLCHAMALSGIPAKEELFSTTLCGNARERSGGLVPDSLDALPPLAVKSLNGRKGSQDLIIGMNTGFIQRLHGATGRREWQLMGKNYDNFPTWDAKTGENALMKQLHANNVAPSISPIVLVGENSMAVISAKSGGLLASSAFPQTSTDRPLLMDLSGDGTQDVIILSTDAIWGFQVTVKPGSPIFLRIVVGLLLMGIMLAGLRNYYGQKDHKRSSDE